jgi:hypothetical protein
MAKSHGAGTSTGVSEDLVGSSVLASRDGGHRNQKSPLLDLPREILFSIPRHLPSIYDLYCLFSTSRQLYDLFGGRDAYQCKLPPILPKKDGQYLMSPHPHFLLALTVRQVADQAARSPQIEDELYEALFRGNEGLLEMVQKYAAVSISEMQVWYELKDSLLNPLSRIIDVEAGPASVSKSDTVPQAHPTTPTISTEDQTNDDASPTASDHSFALTICSEPTLAILNTWIYAELFHGYPAAVLSNSQTHFDPRARGPKFDGLLDLRIRRRWLAMCVPDHNNHRNPHWRKLSQHTNPQLRESGSRGEWQHLDLVQFGGSVSVRRLDQELRRYFKTGELRELNPTEPCPLRGFPFDYDPYVSERQNLCRIVAWNLGKESLEWIIPGFIDRHVGRIERRLGEIREAVDRISEQDIIQWGRAEEEEGWLGWSGLIADVREGIETNLRSDEDLVREERELERRRLERWGWISVP